MIKLTIAFIVVCIAIDCMVTLPKPLAIGVYVIMCVLTLVTLADQHAISKHRKYEKELTKAQAERLRAMLKKASNNKRV